MGASGWEYFVPYQEDINKVFQELRQKVFKEGDYYKSWELSGDDLEGFDQEFEEPAEDPQTIEELIEISATEGTHSIIDMERVALEPSTEREFGVVYPLAKEDLITLFGTDKPTAEDIDNHIPENFEDIYVYIPERWQGIYFIVYKDSKPYQFNFYGISGD